MRLETLTRSPFRFALGMSLVAAIFLVLTPNSYPSEARILPMEEAQGQGLSQMAAVAAAAGVQLSKGDSLDAAYVDILDSHWLHSRLLQSPMEFKYRAWRFGAERAFKGPLADFLEQPNPDLRRRKLQGMLAVTRNPKTRTISIRATTHHPELSQALVHRAVALLGDFLSKHLRGRGSTKARFTEQRLEEARRAQGGAEQAFKAFLTSNRNYQLSPDPTTRVEGARLEADLKLRQQLVTHLAVAVEQALWDEKNDMPLLNVLDEGSLPYEKSGPARALLCVATFLLAWLLAWTWNHRSWIQLQLLGLAGQRAPKP